jgi:phage-related protein
MTLLEAIRTIIPEIIKVATEIVIAFADAVKVAVPHVVEAGLEMILGVLEGIANNIQQIVEAGADIIINFCNGMANKLPDVIQAAFDLAITFIEGLATAIDENHEKLNRAIEHLIKAMVTAFVDFVTNSFPEFKAKAKEMWDKFIEGCKEKLGEMKEAAKELIEKVKEAAVEKVDMLVDVGKDLIRGFIDGIKSMATGVIESVTGVVQGSIDWAKSLLGINSPSKVFKEIGGYVGEGFVVGINSYSDKVSNSAGELADSVIRNVKDPLSNIYKLLDDNIDVNPTIRPVMDLSNIENGTRLLNDMLGDQRIGLNANSVRLAGTVGKIQNGSNNKDIVDALKDLKEGINNGPSYTINGITYDDGSNVSAAVQTLVRAAKIERRL